MAKGKTTGEVCFILTKWYVNLPKHPYFPNTIISFILTKWYVNHRASQRQKII